MLSLIMRIPSTASALLLLLTLSSCGMSRVDQCKALTTVKAPKMSEKPSSEELLAGNKAYLEGYKKLSLSDQDLKEHRDKQVAYYERSIEVSQETIDLNKAIEISSNTTEELRLMIEQSKKTIEISKQGTALIMESIRLCPNGKEQK